MLVERIGKEGLSKATFVIVERGVNEGPINEDELVCGCIAIENGSLAFYFFGEIAVEDLQFIQATPLACGFLTSLGKLMQWNLFNLHLSLQRIIFLFLLGFGILALLSFRLHFFGILLCIKSFSLESGDKEGIVLFGDETKRK